MVVENGTVRLAGILFDFDGLVLDTETSEYLTVAESFADHGLELSRDEWVASSAPPTTRTGPRCSRPPSAGR